VPVVKGRIVRSLSFLLPYPFLSYLYCANANPIVDEPFITHLKTLSPSAADLEIRSMSSDGELVAFVNALNSRLSQKRDYELVQAWMSVFLRLHVDSILLDSELVEALKRWREEQSREVQRLGDLIGYCGGVVGFLRSPRS
jgi:U3 small nucleolar RNA-associated protein 21